MIWTSCEDCGSTDCDVLVDSTPSVGNVRQRPIFTVMLEQASVTSEDGVGDVIIDKAIVELVFHNHLPHRDSSILTSKRKNIDALYSNIHYTISSLKFESEEARANVSLRKDLKELAVFFAFLL